VDTQAVENFYAKLGDALKERWSISGLRPLSQTEIPSDVFGRNAWLLRADHRTTIARWYVEGLVDLARFERSNTNIGHLFKEMIERVDVLAADRTPEEREDLARRLTTFAWREVKLRRSAGRENINQTLKEEVWFASESPQRCYLCGYQFTRPARDLFLRRSGTVLQLRNLVDFTRPRGRKLRHLTAEVDHVIPVAEGGATKVDNLRLACGWCNIAKSRYCSIYDTNSWSKGIYNHSVLGVVSLPQPLWLVRLIATRGCCEEPSGCRATLRDHELFIALSHPRGALNPTNAIVVCQEHDHWRRDRLVDPATLPR
jgi:5-methylcytosine-specific restriction endonuclease McrA